MPRLRSHQALLQVAPANSIAQKPTKELDYTKRSDSKSMQQK
jgi:hypothetical protein